MTAVDLFAGLGGFTLGARWAGVKVLWAANHFQPAVETHGANHPRTKHELQDLHQANWLEVPAHDILCASPCCQGHTKTRGKERPHHDRSRATAWAPVSCLEVHRSPAFVLENVAEFLDWILFPAWCAAMRALGYALSWKVLDAADHGVPQNRLRVFIVGVQGAVPFDLKVRKRRHVAFSTIVDHGAEGWSPVRAHCANTRSRFRNGQRTYGRSFVMPYYSNGSGLTGRSLDRPLGTVTTKDRWAIVEGYNMRMLNVVEYRRAMGFPEDYILPAQATVAKQLLGNAVCPQVVCDVLSDLRRRL